MPASPPPDSVLSVRNLRTYYSHEEGFVRAVDGISFDIPRHGSVGLAGESGSGKTQTVLSILGLVDAVPGIIDGEVWIDGENMLDGLGAYCTRHEADGVLTVTKNVSQWRTVHQERLKRARGDKVSMVFQEPKSSLIPYFTVGQHLRETIAARKGNEAAQAYEEPALALLQRLQFADPRRVLQSYPHQLSGGESQRIMLGLALVGHPQLLIADEPTTALDALIQRSVLETLAAVVRERHLALLLITHNLALMNLLVERVVIMFAGKIVEQGPTAEVIDHANTEGHPYTQALLRAVSDADAPLAAEPAAPLAPMSTEINREGCRYYHRCGLKDLLSPTFRSRCLHEEPPAFTIEPEHTVACWAREESV